MTPPGPSPRPPGCGSTDQGRPLVWASDALTARLNGSGRISYYGQPQVSRDITGSGQVKHLGAR